MDFEEIINLKQLPQNEFKVIDLFCGGGLGAIGIKKAGYEIVYAIDNNKNAVNTYNKNIGNHCELLDIRKLDINTLLDFDILMGSPVCKSFSFAGNNKGFNDEKYGDLSYYYLKVLRSKKPKAFVFENVKGMLSKKHKEYFNELIKSFEEAGYNVSYQILNAYDYGVAQLRERLFIIGIRKDLDKKYEFPTKLENKFCIKDVISDLKAPTKIMNSSKDIQFVSNNINIPNHIGYGIRNDEKPYVDKIPSGQNWRALNEEDAKLFLGKSYYNGGGRTGFLRKVDCNNPSYTITSTMNGKNNAQIIDNQDIYYEAGYSSMYLSRNRQKQWNEPSYTIVSHVRQLPLYPEPSNYDIRIMDIKESIPPRRFTVRECLRLQSVPDWFIIDEEMSLSKQYEIVGNGIPSLLTYSVFKELLNYLY